MSLHLWRCACWIMCNHCFQAHAAVSVLICSQPPQSVIMVHLHSRVKNILLKIVPMSQVWEKMISHQTQPPRRCFAVWVQHFWIWCAECGWAAVEQSAADSDLSCLQDHGQFWRAPAGYMEPQWKQSRSSDTGLRQGTLVLQTQDLMRCLTC